MLRFVCISDTHGMHGDVEVPPGDVLIHAGDFTNTGELDQIESLLAFMQKQPHTHKILIAGNHDVTLEKDYYVNNYGRYHRQPYDPDQARTMVENTPGVTYLEDQAIDIEGYRFWGSPYQPEFCDWAFNLPRGDACRRKWREIPDDTEILVTHGPPLGHGDLVRDGSHSGCADLLDEVTNRIKPLYHVFGHAHRGYGVSTDGTTTFINAACCTSDYKPIQRPLVFELPTRVIEIQGGGD